MWKKKTTPSTGNSSLKISPRASPHDPGWRWKREKWITIPDGPTYTNRVEIWLNTHDAGDTVTERIILARRIDKLIA